mmetsp:Transcript_301/g.451  ORF Transcript_301/g.451 Transcript_301/m.451 type:complete len:117 (+) Transcript_301:76-426(+)
MSQSMSLEFCMGVLRELYITLVRQQPMNTTYLLLPTRIEKRLHQFHNHFFFLFLFAAAFRWRAVVTTFFLVGFAKGFFFVEGTVESSSSTRSPFENKSFFFSFPFAVFAPAFILLL